MSEEQSFLDALKASPFDDTTRLVYADWLDEQGRAAEAEYLRLVVALVPDCDGEGEAGRRALALAEELPVEWREAAAGRFATHLYGLDPPRKIQVIKLIREATGVGLAEAKGLSEQLPSRLADRATFERAHRVRADLLREETFISVHPAEILKEELPFAVRCRVVLGVAFFYWVVPPPPPEAGRAALRAVAAEELKLTPDEVAARWPGDSLVIAEKLDAKPAERMVARLRARFPLGVGGTDWYLYANAVPTGFVRRDAE